MTNKEKYKKSFSALHTSAELLLEVRSMEKNKKRPIPRWAAACAAVVMTFGLSLGIYAAGKMIKMWRHGEKIDAVMEYVDNGIYNVTFKDENGEEKTHKHTMTVKEGYYGEERPATEEEFIEGMKRPRFDVSFKDDDTVWVYYPGNAIEVTDQFDENGLCHLTINFSGDTYYILIRDDGFFASDTNDYPTPDWFN